MCIMGKNMDLSERSEKDFVDSEEEDKRRRLWECLLEVTKDKLLEIEQEEVIRQKRRLSLKEKSLKKPMVFDDYDNRAMMINTINNNKIKRLGTNQHESKPIIYDDDDDDDDYVVDHHAMMINTVDNNKRKNDKRSGTNKKPKTTGKNDENKKKGGNEKKKKSNVKWNGPEPAPDMPIRMKDFVTRELKGREIQLVIQKALYDSDCRKGQNRLNIPEAQVINKGFLTEDEKKELVMQVETKKKAINVTLVDPRQRVFEISLRRWEQNKNFNYVLSNPWIQIVEENNFHQGVVVQVWSFRVDSELGFAIVRVADGPPAAAEGGGSGGGGDESDMGLGASSSGHGGGNVGHDHMEE